MIKTRFLVPERDNEGRPFCRGDWNELHRRLRDISEGFTWRGGVNGEWEHAGRVYRDRSREYEVSIISWKMLPRWLETIDWVKDRFRQLALYGEVNGLPEVF